METTNGDEELGCTIYIKKGLLWSRRRIYKQLASLMRGTYDVKKGLQLSTCDILVFRNTEYCPKQARDSKFGFFFWKYHLDIAKKSNSNLKEYEKELGQLMNHLKINNYQPHAICNYDLYLE